MVQRSMVEMATIQLNTGDIIGEPIFRVLMAAREMIRSSIVTTILLSMAELAMIPYIIIKDHLWVSMAALEMIRFSMIMVSSRRFLQVLELIQFMEIYMLQKLSFTLQTPISFIISDLEIHCRSILEMFHRVYKADLIFYSRLQTARLFWKI